MINLEKRESCFKIIDIIIDMNLAKSRAQLIQL